VTYLFVAIAIITALIIWGFNIIVRAKNIVRTAWSDIDVQLKRRSDLIPNLVESTKGYAGFERETLESVVRARSAIESSSLSPSERASKEGQLAERVATIVAVAEKYPELKASTQFMKLQEELSRTESDIANARRYYNAATRDLNTLLDSFPIGLLGKLLGFRKEEFFSIDNSEERDAPSARLDQ
jgi:LemA protein